MNALFVHVNIMCPLLLFAATHLSLRVDLLLQFGNSNKLAGHFAQHASHQSCNVQCAQGGEAEGVGEGGGRSGRKNNQTYM